MRLDEYLESVSEQIRCTKMRSSVTDELKNHILDQAEDYEQCGALPEEALERAIRDMGDPVETGVALDRIHRPQMNFGILGLIGIISLLCIGFFYLMSRQISAQTMLPWHRQAMFICVGFALMLIVYRLDYSILERFGWKPAVLFFTLFVLGWYLFSRPVNGASHYIFPGGFMISVSEAMLLYVPLFGAALYSFRKDGYLVLAKVLPLILLPVLFLWQTPDLSAAMILFCSLLLLFLFAVANDWYTINRTWVIGISAGILFLTPAALLGGIFFFGSSYQTERIRAFFNPGSDADYIVRLVKRIQESSALMGSSERSVALFANGPSSDFLTDYVLVSMCSIYGILLTIAIIAALFLIILKIFHISINQKNQLGRIIGVGCGLVFLVKTLGCVLVNLRLIPYVSISMPFLSYGGSGTLVSYILLGLVLSIYRYKNILPDKKTTHSVCE